MKTSINNLFIVTLLSASLFACAEMTTHPTDKTKIPYISDVSIPKTAYIDLNKSMIVGSGEEWTGHLVYYTSNTPLQTINYINTEMEKGGWKKVSGLTSKESFLSFMKGKRLATFKIIENQAYAASKTTVYVDMTVSNLKAVSNKKSSRANDYEEDDDSDNNE